METKISSKFIAELIGTFGLVLFGCGAAAVAGADTLAQTSGLGLLGIALAFGFSGCRLCLCHWRHIGLPHQPGGDYRGASCRKNIL